MRSAIKTMFLISVFALFSSAQAFASLSSGSSVWLEPGYLNFDGSEDMPHRLWDVTDSANPISYVAFCLEPEVGIPAGDQYTLKVVSVGEYVIGGGPNGSDDYLEDDTKWLYANYMEGNFSAEADAGQRVRNAIFHLEEENNGPLVAPGYKEDYEYLTGLSSYERDTLGWTVQAVNIEQSEKHVQGLLVGHENPVPEPATMILFGFGLLGFTGVNRKKIK